MNKDYYRRAINYAYFLDGKFNKDLVHQAYLDYWSAKGKDLFDSERIGTVLQAVKWAYWASLKKVYGGGPIKSRVFESYLEQRPNYLTPDIILEGKDLEEYIYDMPTTVSFNPVTISVNKLIELKLRGFKNTEIAKHLGVTPALITYHLKKIMAHINNPLRTSTVPLSKKMSRRTFEERYKQDYVFDMERNCDHNESYQIVVHKDRDEYILIKEKEDVAETIARINESQ